MAKELSACRVCRRASVKLFLKGERCNTPKCAIVKRNYPPGVHGAKKGKPRLTTYGIQLREKQKARMFYGVSEKQFRNYFEKAAHSTGNTGEQLVHFLEMRLDNVILRLGWAQSHRHARQLVAYGAILVDGKKVTIPSYQVRAGQIIAVEPKSLEAPHFKTITPQLEKQQVSGWLFADPKKFEGKILGIPTIEDAQPLYDVKLIIEFYSR